MSPASKWVTVAGPTGITRTGCLVTTADKLYRCTFQGSINHRLVRYLSVELLKSWISNAGILESLTLARKDSVCDWGHVFYKASRYMRRSWVFQNTCTVVFNIFIDGLCKREGFRQLFSKLLEIRFTTAYTYLAKKSR